MEKKVAILMCTYNGQAFLAEQLRSFADQSFTNWDLWVSDDGSSDETLHILQEFSQKNPSHTVHVIKGPRKGFAKNFLSLSSHPDIQADFFAISDQDDVWDIDKIQVAVDWLETIPYDTPALYTCRVELIDGEGQHIGYSPSCPKEPSFRNALVQNIAGGHTMVMNKAAHAALQNSSNVDVPFHDWWFYLCVTGLGGKVHFDERALAKYRQHGGNLVGLNSSIIAKSARFLRLLRGDYARHYAQNCVAIHQIKGYFPDAHQRIFEQFQSAWERKLFGRILNMLKLHLYAQTKVKAFAFWGTVALGGLSRKLKGE